MSSGKRQENMFCCCTGCSSSTKHKGKRKKALSWSFFDEPEEHISFHQFPTDHQLRSAWLANITRPDFEPSKHAKVCGKHFESICFTEESRDTNVTRKRSNTILKKRKLLPDAIPTLFLGGSKPPPFKLSKKEKKKDIKKEEKQLYLREKIDSFSELIDKMTTVKLSENIKIHQDPNHLVYYSIVIEDDSPKIGFSLTIKNDLSFIMKSGKYKTAISKVSHICKSEKIVFISQISKLLEYLHANPIVKDKEMILGDLLDAFDEYLNVTPPSSHLEFIREQLSHCSTRAKNGRRYSTQILGTASLWQAISPALYNEILSSDMIALPTVKHLRRIARPLKCDPHIGDSTSIYLEKRISTLDESDKIVSIIVDEVHSARRIEYSNGKLYGSGNNGTPTKTMLCFFIKSVLGNYSDMVAMIPLVTINSSILKEHFLKVLELVTKLGFTTVSVVMDDHSVNRKFYFNEMSMDETCSQVTNPFSQNEETIFMIFHPINVFKRIYHNFLSSPSLVFPSYNGDQILTAKLDDVKSVFEREIGVDTKIAIKLNREAIQLQPFRKTNVNLGGRLFDDSTVQALSHYGNSDEVIPSYLETSEFLKIVNKFWNCVSEVSKQPVESSFRDEIKFLESFCEWLNKWKGMAKDQESLSNEAFKSAIHTTRGLANLGTYLLEQRNINSLSFQKLASNPMERRFGSYRMLGGGNYWLSCRQLLESEKRIRIESLLKTKIRSFASLKETFPKSLVEENSEQHGKEFCEIISHIDITDFDELAGVENVVYYLSGTIGQSLLKTVTLSCCKELICSSDVDITIITDESGKHEVLSSFIKDLSEGELKSPSDVFYLVSMHYYKMLHNIFQSNDIRNKLFSFESPRQVFTSAMNKIIKEQENLSWINTSECSNHHKFSKLLNAISFNMFNVFAKNYTSEINNQLQNSKKRKDSAPPATSADDQAKRPKKISPPSNT